MRKQTHLPEQISKVEFHVGGFMYGYTIYTFSTTDTGALLKTSSWTSPESETVFSHYETVEFQKKIADLKTENWKTEYAPVDVVILDGTEWSLKITYNNGQSGEFSGDNAYPSKWDDLIEIFGYNEPE